MVLLSLRTFRFTEIRNNAIKIAQNAFKMENKMSLKNNILAIQNFDPAKNNYLFVQGHGADACLVTRKVGFLGRIWLWICIKFGCSNASMKKIASFVANQAAALFPKLPLRDLKRLMDKIHKYDKRHPNAISKEVALINTAFQNRQLALPQGQASQQTAKSNASAESPQGNAANAQPQPSPALPHPCQSMINLFMQNRANDTLDYWLSRSTDLSDPEVAALLPLMTPEELRDHESAPQFGIGPFVEKGFTSPDFVQNCNRIDFVADKLSQDQLKGWLYHAISKDSNTQELFKFLRAITGSARAILARPEDEQYVLFVWLLSEIRTYKDGFFSEEEVADCLGSVLHYLNQVDLNKDKTKCYEAIMALSMVQFSEDLSNCRNVLGIEEVIKKYPPLLLEEIYLQEDLGAFLEDSIKDLLTQYLLTGSFNEGFAYLNKELEDPERAVEIYKLVQYDARPHITITNLMRLCPKDSLEQIKKIMPLHHAEYLPK